MAETIFAILLVLTLLSPFSFFVIRAMAQRPANGEVRRLQNIETKLERNVKHLAIVEKQRNHFIRVS